ncbi:MAG: M20/M25/M40 family metallo-hydrolase [Clostridiales bacterium]|nr:M20/M25/M40 family metallo-hydrolase [Clostridiales bacterium]
MKKKLSPSIASSTMSYIVKGIEQVCKTFKDRAPGTQSERDCQDFFAKELEPWADEVRVEKFKLSPKAFMGFIPISALFGIFASILFFLNNYGPSKPVTAFAMALLVAAFLMFLFEFILYRQFVDFLFPKAISKNVYAVKKPKGEVKKRIIFGGHADAAYEWTYSLHGQTKTLAPAIGGSIGGMIMSMIFVIAYFIAGTPEFNKFWKGVSIYLLVNIVFYIAIMFFTNWRVIVDGANDNLTACYASMAILKEMTENDFRFENTEVACLITGSEEAGLRGAKAFAKKHNKELKEVPTLFVALETLRETKELAVYTRDNTGTVHNDEEAAEMLIAAGKKLDIDLPRAPVYPGSTDAAAFTQAGIRAIGLGGVNHDPQTYYHTRHDSYDNISPECIEKALEISYEAAYMFDANESIDLTN